MAGYETNMGESLYLNFIAGSYSIKTIFKRLLDSCISTTYTPFGIPVCQELVKICYIFV